MPVMLKMESEEPKKDTEEFTVITEVPEVVNQTIQEITPIKSDFDNIFPEAVIFGLAAIALYVVFRLIISLLPVLITIGGTGIAAYFLYKVV
jgi:hypothetical protein